MTGNGPTNRPPGPPSASKVGATPAPTQAEPLFSLGAKGGFFPPLFGVAEILLRPVAHAGLGVFGLWSPIGIGSGGARTTLGAEALFEPAAGRRSGWYGAGAFAWYHAARDGHGFYETSAFASTTAGYQWKWRRGELQTGAGVTRILFDDTAPCTGSFCVRFKVSWLPAIDATLRFGL